MILQFLIDRLITMKQLLQNRVQNRIRQASEKVFIRRDFESFGKSSSTVGKVLGNLVKLGVLVKAGHGIYVKAKPSSLTGNPIPAASLTEIALTALSKLGVNAALGKSARAYIAGETTQLPMATTIDAGNVRISRRIGFGDKIVRYENSSQRNTKKR